MSTGLDVTAGSNASAIAKRLERAGEELLDLQQVWPDLHDWWKTRQTLRFSNSHMAHLEGSTVDRKKANKDVPLVATGALRQSTYQYLIRPTRTTVRLGIPAGKPIRKLAILHMHFRRRTRRVAVQPLDRAESAMIRKMINDHVTEVLDGRRA